MRKFLALLLCYLVYLPSYSQSLETSGAIKCVADVTLSIKDAAPSSTFSWELSENGGANWSSIPGASGISYKAIKTGKYRAKVTTGGANIDTEPIDVIINPVIDFSFTNNNACSGTTIQFTSSTTTGTPPFTYSWNFGDGTTSSAQNPTHAYTSLGCSNANFTVALTVTDANGCSSVISKQLTVKQKPDVQVSDLQNPFSEFSNCANSPSSSNANFIVRLNNSSPSAGCITSYSVNWGDGTVQNNITSASFPLTHTYTQLGTFDLVVTATGSNGCINSRTYKVVNQSNPAVGISAPGSTSGCAPSGFWFKLSRYELNSPGTTYEWDFGDGSPKVTWTTPVTVDSIFHTFTKTSCGLQNDQFIVKVTAVNGCKATTATVDNITIYQKPTAGFTSPLTACVNQTIQLTNTAIAGYNPGSCNRTTTYQWDFGDGRTAAQTSPSISYATAGTYTVTLIATSACGNDTATKQICVTNAPVAAFSIDKNTGCGPLTVAITNTSNTSTTCANTSYAWSVTYSAGSCGSSSSWSYAGGSNASSAQPSFIFSNPGTYTITLAVTNSCGTVTTSKTVTVRKPPVVSLAAISDGCGPLTINPSATVSSCGSTGPTYAWSFPGGSTLSSSAATPGAVTYTAAGTYTITVDVTNECGTTSANRSFIVGQSPDVRVPADAVICAGATTGSFSFNSSIAGTTYRWTNSNTTIGLAASGTGSIASFTAINTTTTQQVATITVTPVNGCSGPSRTFSITVNPKLSTPTVTSPVSYCLQAVANPLTASATGTLIWYTNPALTSGSVTPPTPATATPGTTTYYVTQKNAFTCESSAAPLTVTVLPSLTGNTIGGNQSICAGTSPAILSGTTPLTGGTGSFTYQWQNSNDDGGTWNNIPGATSATYSPGSLSATTKYKRVVNSGTCTNNESNIIAIIVEGSLSNVGISAPQTICAGATPALLVGQAPAGGSGTYTYAWESSSDGITWTNLNITTADYQPPTLLNSTYYRRKVIGGSCSVYSATLKITVNPKPGLSTLTSSGYCAGSVVPASNFTSSPATGVTYAWTNDNSSIGLAASGTGNQPSFTTLNTANPKIPLTATITVTPTFSADGVSCDGNAASYKLTVLPLVTIQPISSKIVCKGETIAALTPVSDAAPFTGAAVSYKWSITGSGISLTAGSGPEIPSYTAINNGTTDLIATITVIPQYGFEGKTCEGTPVSYTITVKPGANSNAGSDQILCAQTTATLNANTPATTGLWTEVGGTTVTIANASTPTTTITGLVPGTTYRFVWTVAGFAACPPASDEVVIDVLAPLTSDITQGTVTICSGQTAIINGVPPTGGNLSYTYQWQSSPDGITWSAMPGQTGANLSFAPAQTLYVRRVVLSSNCTKESNPVQIIVQAAVSNNSITANQSICIGTTAAVLKGSQPSGANGNYFYQWQQSSDGITWSDISGATQQDYDPTALTVTTHFRRKVTTALCTGPQSSFSNSVRITVNPDAKAAFNPTTLTGCTPFSLTPSLLRLQPYPDRNASYEWYANGLLIGTSVTFPTYTISGSDQHVTIKLKAISPFGCKADSMEYAFTTIKEPVPAFTQSATMGCGPLTVTFSNTTADAALFTYEWNFGNGKTSNALQPGAITFAPNPSFNDTTYVITLKAISPCTTITTTKTELVKSKPKALFTPDKSIGCSPMTVVFSNTSLGVGNTYTWDFGDGTTETTTKKEAVSHTFITGVRDTFYVKLKAANDCGQDEQVYAIVVTPNAIRLDFAVNGNEHLGCAPHPVRFINNTSGATAFRWDFGDGNVLSTSKNIDTVTHAYLTAGTYTVKLMASNGCSDTTTTETITVFGKPVPAFTASQPRVCIGEAVRFSNGSSDATSYLWKFGDGAVSTQTSPDHHYTTPGVYTVVLITFKASAPGVVCSDSVQQQIQVVSTLPGDFDASALTGKCLPLTINFTNRHQPSVTATWDFGDGSTGSGDVVSHTYTKPGNYTVRLTTTVPGGCTYTATKVVQANGPYGELTYTGGLLCNDQAVRLEATVVNTDQLVWDFGDGTQLTTTDRTVFHRYAHAGKFVPSVSLLSNSGCSYPLKGVDTLFVDKITAGFQYIDNKTCGSTTLHFSDTSHVFFGKKRIDWNFGDGTTGTGATPVHKYTASGTYKMQLTVTGVSGCVETVSRSIDVVVYDKPSVDIIINNKPCTNQVLEFKAAIASIDPITHIQWLLSNGVKGTGTPFTTTITSPGNYTAQVIVGTVNGCFDTADVTFRVDPSPVVTASDDITLCRGGSTNLSASGASQYSWSPLSGLSCTTCATPRATPLATTPYVVTGTNSFGCADRDTVVVSVIQPFKMQVSPNDSICIGSSTLLQASGATTYNWSPAAGLSSTSVSNPVAKPDVTTRYRVVGYDGYNCFTDTAFVTVAIGLYPTIELGPDLTLSTGTLHPLTSTVQNGPIRTWQWSPTTDLSCANCPLPVAHIKKDITYTVKATTPYGCSDTDTLTIKTFCESAQVFIPNAFTPDGDGINDIAMVRGKGIVSVKTFRIFNRWGEVVFERSSFPPNETRYGWDGKIRGVIGGPDVFVFTAEVVCENGTTYTYKGNISIIK